MLGTKKQIMSKESFVKLCKTVERLDEKLRSEIHADGIYQHGVKESYSYIPFYETHRLYELFSAIRKREEGYREEIRLLDVGAGTGRIVYLAKRCGISAVGIEFHAPYVEYGRTAYKLSEDELQVRNAFELEPEFLGKFRVIYTYMPLNDQLRMSELHWSMASKIQNALRSENYRVDFVEMLPRYYPMSSVSGYADEGSGNYRTWIPNGIATMHVRSQSFSSM